LACLQAAIDDQEYVSEYVLQIKRGRERLERALESYGIKHWPSQANFILLRIGARHRDFVNAMLRRKILVRDRDSDPGCAGCVRITIGTPPQMDLLLAALPECLQEIGWANAMESAR
jgi:histidinol-phosphate aminotransferase